MGSLGVRLAFGIGLLSTKSILMIYFSQQAATDSSFEHNIFSSCTNHYYSKLLPIIIIIMISTIPIMLNGCKY